MSFSVGKIIHLTPSHSCSPHYATPGCRCCCCYIILRKTMSRTLYYTHHHHAAVRVRARGILHAHMRPLWNSDCILTEECPHLFAGKTKGKAAEGEECPCDRDRTFKESIEEKKKKKRCVFSAGDRDPPPTIPS